MALPYELLIGLRYTRAKRRNHFISFISLISMLGIGLGRCRADRRAVGDERLSEGVAHAHPRRGLAYPDHRHQWRAGQLAGRCRAGAEAPEVRARRLSSSRRDVYRRWRVKGALVRGILPDQEDKVADFRKTIKSGSLDDLRPGEFGIVLGADLARRCACLPATR
jgi:lipoprotein-releasing system permease protein